MPSSASLPSDPGRPGPSPGLWRDADFRRLWIGQTASQLGEQGNLVVLPLLAVLTLGAGPGELGVLRAVGQAPVLLLSLCVGAWVDRWRTRTVMVVADGARTLLMGAAATAGLLGCLGPASLPALAFTVGALSVFFDVAYQASLVRLVARDRLASGNSALEGSRSAAQFGGPALGGALVSLLSAPAAAAADALFFAVSCGAVGGIRRTESIPDHAADPPRVRRRILEGLRFVAGDGTLRTVCLASAAFQFSLAATMTVYLPFLPRELHLSGAFVGLALAAAGPGALVGSLLAARLPGRFGYGPVLVGAAALGDGVFLCVPALRPSSAVTVPALLAVGFVSGLGGQLVNVAVMTVRQAVTPDGMQGRTAATITFVGMGSAPFGSLFGGFLGQRWGLRTSLLVTAAGMMMSPAVMAASPLARLGRVLPVSGDAPLTGTHVGSTAAESTVSDLGTAGRSLAPSRFRPLGANPRARPPETFPRDAPGGRQPEADP
ncbi:MFS transporter [Streptomyces sp. NPDC004324]